MIRLRTDAEKGDLQGSWLRPDREFFSAGACHVLAGVFLETHPEFSSYLLQPAPGFRGGHVLVVGDDVTFDWLGYQPRRERLARFHEERRAAMPGWHCEMIRIADPLSWAFCREFRHRHPSEFPGDVMVRARRFLHELETDDHLAKGLHHVL